MMQNKIAKSLISLSIIFALFIFISPQLVFAAQPTVDLGTAATYAILAGTPAITESGAHTSAITGNVGLSPRTSVDIGLYCSQMLALSKIYGVDTAYVGDGIDTSCFHGTPSDKTLVDNAKLDLTAAYTDAAGRIPVSTINTELGGQTLVSGVYASNATTFGITAGAGPLILDGQGDNSSVFIFEVASSSPGLVIGPGSVVTLTNGACASNVFWRVDTASINTTATFKGSILALNSITVANGANIEGRLLARNGEVTLINDTVRLPTTCASVTPTPTANPALSLTSAGASSSYCPPLSSQIVDPTIVESKRVSPTSISLSWAPYSGTNLFNVQYGFTNGQWLYSTNVTGFSTTINSLPANLPIWVRVAAGNGCMVGGYGQPMLVGGPMLPNTGFAPGERIISWLIPSNIFSGISYLFSFAH